MEGDTKKLKYFIRSFLLKIRHCERLKLNLNIAFNLNEKNNG